jgi:serine/threonine protein kinase
MDSERDDPTKPANDATTPIEKVETKAGATQFEVTVSAAPLFNDRYLIEKELGRGGIGITYLARDSQLHSMPVVIKVLIEKPGNKEWVRRKFIQESEALTRIAHPGVVKVLNRGEFSGGKPFFVMEFVEGRPLRSAILPEGMDFEFVASILEELGNALQAAHEKKIIHRDLKPENIMLQTLSGGEEAVKIIDFGIAKMADSQAGNTTEGDIIAGSLHYMAPEQLLSQTVSPATDIYALAIIAYEMLTGRKPFNVDAKHLLASLQQLLQMQRDGVDIKPKQLRPSLPEATQEILLNALVYDPHKRPQEAKRFCDDLVHSLTAAANVFSPAFQRAAETALIGAAETDRLAEAKKTKNPQPEKAELQPTPEDEKVTRVASANLGFQTKADSQVDALPPDSPTQDSPTAGKRSFQPLMLAAIVLVLAIVGVIVWQALRPKPAPPPEAVAPPKTPISLSYFLTVQRDPNRYRGSKPFQLEREMLFGDGDLIRFTFVAPQDGHLYIFNESPASSASTFSILFPSPTTNKGSSKLTAEQQIVVPGNGGWFKLVKDEGTEKLWIVWTSASIDKLEALKKWANAKDLGEMKDAAQVSELKNLLASQANQSPAIERNEARKQTTLTLQGDMLVKMIALEHH